MRRQSKTVIHGYEQFFYTNPNRRCLQGHCSIVDEWFDTSNYPSDHPSGIKAGVNHMIPGKMKDELAGKQVKEFCGLDAKTYSFDNGERKAKCVNKATKKKHLTHEDYLKILNEKTDKEIECMKIGSEKFRLTTRKERKLGLTHEDIKRVPNLNLDENISNWKERHHETYAIGHYALRE